MTTDKKIELALADLASALGDIAERSAHTAIDNRDVDTWFRLVNNHDHRLLKQHERIVTLENADLTAKLDQDVADELHAAHRCISALQEQLDRAERRIADLERDLGELSTLDNTRRAVADMINDGDIRLHVD